MTDFRRSSRCKFPHWSASNRTTVLQFIRAIHCKSWQILEEADGVSCCHWSTTTPVCRPPTKFLKNIFEKNISDKYLCKKYFWQNLVFLTNERKNLEADEVKVSAIDQPPTNLRTSGNSLFNKFWQFILSVYFFLYVPAICFNSW